MNLLKKTTILIIAVLFVLWGQLAAFQHNCSCSFDIQYQEESMHSCCSNQQGMPMAHGNTPKEVPQESGCHDGNAHSELSLAKQDDSHEYCQSRCDIVADDHLYFSSLTSGFDIQLLHGSAPFTMIPADIEYPSLYDEYIPQHIPIPIFLLNVSFLN